MIVPPDRGCREAAGRRAVPYRWRDAGRVPRAGAGTVGSRVADRPHRVSGARTVVRLGCRGRAVAGGGPAGFARRPPPAARLTPATYPRAPPPRSDGGKTRGRAPAAVPYGPARRAGNE